VLLFVTYQTTREGATASFTFDMKKMEGKKSHGSDVKKTTSFHPQGKAVSIS